MRYAAFIFALFISMFYAYADDSGEDWKYRYEKRDRVDVGPILFSNNRYKLDISKLKYSDFEPGGRLVHCDNNDYYCVIFFNSGFAVPKNKYIQGGEKYTVGGIVYNVVKCYNYKNNRCEYSLIKADCQLLVNENECKPYPGGRSKSYNKGILLYFKYKYGVGVYSYGDATGEAKENADYMSTLYTLKGKRGLLYIK